MPKSFPSKKPDPKDYPGRINAFTKDAMAWERLQPRPPVAIPEELLELFTDESLENAKLAGHNIQGEPRAS